MSNLFSISSLNRFSLAAMDFDANQMIPFKKSLTRILRIEFDVKIWLKLASRAVVFIWGDFLWYDYYLRKFNVRLMWKFVWRKWKVYAFFGGFLKLPKNPKLLLNDRRERKYIKKIIKWRRWARALKINLKINKILW